MLGHVSKSDKVRGRRPGEPPGRANARPMTGSATPGQVFPLRFLRGFVRCRRGWLRGENPRQDHLPGHGTRTIRPRNRPACRHFRQQDFPLVTES